MQLPKYSMINGDWSVEGDDTLISPPSDAWKKKWIILAQSEEDLSFDVRHIRTILYSNRMGAGQKLRADLTNAIRETMGMG
ncbi:MAG: hypothetical protein ACRD8O_08050 [Bryobacteraceae bacterium]